jgi:hypothetical protein
MLKVRACVRGPSNLRGGARSYAGLSNSASRSGRKPYARVSTDTRLAKSSFYALLAVISANSRARLAALRAAFLSS